MIHGFPRVSLAPARSGGHRAAALLLAVGACSGELAAPLGPPPTAPTVDVREPTVGTPDRGSDPAVVAVESDGALTCAGALLAPDLVLTARHCATGAGLTARVTSDAVAWGPRSAVSRAATPDDPTLDVAILMLDTPLGGVAPLAVRSRGAASGDRVRTVEIARSADGLGTKIVRDHVSILGVGPSLLALDEAPCAAGCGGPVIDEDTAEVVGVVVAAGDVAGAAGGDVVDAAQGGDVADAAPGGDVADAAQGGDVAVRTDVVLSFIAEALAGAAPATGTHLLKTKRGAVDLGATCEGAVDCAAGVCVSDAARRYCSRACGAGDRCPAHWRCVLCRASEGPSSAVRACVES